MWKMKVIEPAESKRAAHIVTGKKKDTLLRLCRLSELEFRDRMLLLADTQNGLGFKLLWGRVDSLRFGH